MAFKVIRTFGIKITMGKCDCSMSKNFEDSGLSKVIGETTFIPCKTHAAKKGVIETIEMFMEELLDKEIENIKKEINNQPRPSRTNENTTENLNPVEEAVDDGKQKEIRIPVNVKKTKGAPAFRRASTASAAPGVSKAVATSRAVGGGSSLDAEIAASTPTNKNVALGVTKQSLSEVLEETDGEANIFDVVLGSNDPATRA